MTSPERGDVETNVIPVAATIHACHQSYSNYAIEREDRKETSFSIQAPLLVPFSNRASRGFPIYPSYTSIVQTL